MKTKLLTILAITITAIAFNIAQARAESCEGGTLQTGENGHVYCQSNNQMNWWSAYTWCEAQGRHLASMYEVCPTWDGSTGYDKCNQGSFSNNEYNWTATASDTESAFIFDQNTVQNDTNSTRRSNSYCLALCY